MRNAFIAIALFIVILSLILPTPAGLSRDGFIMLAILAMAIILWITEAIPIAATGLLILALQPLLGVADAKDVFASFGNKAVFFILASFMIAGAVEKYGLHKRMAIKFLKMFGKSPKLFIFGVMLTGASLSFIMQGHAVAVLLLPILMHILVSMKITPKESNFGIVSMLALAYGTTIGSCGTLLGGARNPLTIAFLDGYGYEISFLDWMKINLPFVFISIPVITAVLLLLYPPEIRSIDVAIEELEKEVYKMGRMTKNEKTLIGILISTIFLWIFFSSQLGVAVIALLAVSALFLLKLINWEDVEKRVQWGIILVYGGAITMGKNLEATNAAEWLALKITAVFSNPYIILACIIIITFILTNFMSNTAAVATMLPISLSLANKIGISAAITAMATATAGGVAFLFVIATPAVAIAYSSGYITQRNLLKAGIISAIICLSIIYILSIVYWQFILKL